MSDVKQTVTTGSFTAHIFSRVSTVRLGHRPNTCYYLDLVLLVAGGSNHAGILRRFIDVLSSSSQTSQH